MLIFHTSLLTHLTTHSVLMPHSWIYKTNDNYSSKATLINANYTFIYNLTLHSFKSRRSAKVLTLATIPKRNPFLDSPSGPLARNAFHPKNTPYSPIKIATIDHGAIFSSQRSLHRRWKDPASTPRFVEQRIPLPSSVRDEARKNRAFLSRPFIPPRSIRPSIFDGIYKIENSFLFNRFPGPIDRLSSDVFAGENPGVENEFATLSRPPTPRRSSSGQSVPGQSAI